MKIKFIYMVIWATLLISQLIYYLQTLLVKPVSSTQIRLLTDLFFGISALIVLATAIMRYKLIYQPITEGKRDIADSGDAGKLLVYYIIILVLCDAISVFGLVAFFLGYPAAVYDQFFVIGVGATALQLPIEVLRKRERRGRVV